MFDKTPDYKKMEYTSNRLRKEFMSIGRVARQSDRRSPYGRLLTPWEHLDVSEKEQCSFDALKFNSYLNRLRIGRKAYYSF